MNSYNSSYSFSSGGMQMTGARRSDASNSDASIDGRMGRMESDISYTKRDISDIKSDIKELRNDIKDIRKDMRKDLILVFGAFVGLASMMAKGFGWF
ncbi:hypothetical protein FKL60_17430 [Klebsiella pneumoniae]|uniref:DUF2730 domain-containing protein n=1 Tax=Klebsiella michiganensis TaxID=1134687 RepID=UPI001CCB33DB|nr:DUF2730 domain-containing protein [Klebsiella michiganensis]MBK2424071.1 hypothetical protein [Klebsiella pneumoniae]MBZ6613821.1 hypothetical protein [Klebsiella pneumoniae]MBZ7504121.1 hypothetical protein [Klebsiella michiganensis]HBW7857875.1 hypothetical protein [Klebsiella pneumoniae]HBW8544217.1 hypothetical protein [Klebsiella pneumoniae]